MFADILGNRKEGLLNLCKSHKVNKLFVFGSALNNSFNPRTSDLDLLVEMSEKDPIEKGEKLISLWDNLEEFFKRRVDLLTDQPIKNPYLKASIERTKVLIYDGEREKILV